MNEQSNNRPEIRHITHEKTLITDTRNVVRVIALHRITAEESTHMLTPYYTPDSASAQDIQDAFIGSGPRDLCLTYTIWILKEGAKSGNQLMLPGGGIESKKITPNTINAAGVREIKEELGHTVEKSRVLADTRTYSFTTRLENMPGFYSKRTNTEYLIVAHISPNEKTYKQFSPSENIAKPVLLFPDRVTSLLQTDEYTDMDGNTAYLLDSLSLHKDRRDNHKIEVNMSEVLRTRRRIEYNAWIHEAHTQRALCTLLLSKTNAVLSDTFRQECAAVLSRPKPITVEDAQDFTKAIQRIYVHIESAYEAHQHPKKHMIHARMKEQLRAAGIPRKAIEHRELFMQEVHACLNELIEKRTLPDR